MRTVRFNGEFWYEDVWLRGAPAAIRAAVEHREQRLREERAARQARWS